MKKTRYYSMVAWALALICLAQPGYAQDDKLQVYGYAQNLFQHRTYDQTLDFRRNLLRQLEPFREQFAQLDPMFPGVDISPEGIIGQDNLNDAVLNTDTEDNFFSAQQLNIFLNKPFANKFNALVNLEFINNTNTGLGRGEVSMQEAWVNYRHSRGFQIRAGKLLPKFNQLNEIRNRTPLFNYATRPLIYESFFRNLFEINNFVPQNAFLQLHGDIGLSDELDFQWAAYLGNGDDDNVASGLPVGLSQNNLKAHTDGIDSTAFMMVGGRAGLSLSSLDWGDLKIGVSGTYDHENRESFAKQRINIGMIPRTRIGLDFSWIWNDLELEAEAVFVNHNLSSGDKELLRRRTMLFVEDGNGNLLGQNGQPINSALDFLTVGPLPNDEETAGLVQAVSQFNNGGLLAFDPTAAAGIDKRYFYVNASYYLTPKLYVTGRVERFEDQAEPLFEDGPMWVYGAGAGYRFNRSLVVKTEWTGFRINDNEIIDHTSDYFRAAVAFLF